MKKINLSIWLGLILGTTAFAQTTSYGSTGLNQTNSSQPIIFKNSGSEKVRIDNNGNVGVGTSAPSEKLEVNGNIKLTGTIISTSAGTTTLQDLKLSSLSGTGNRLLFVDPTGKLGIGTLPTPCFSTSNSGLPWILGGNYSTVPGDDFIGTCDDKDIVFKTNSSERMRIMTGNGNVGIGTSTPQLKFVVNGNASLISGNALNGFEFLGGDAIPTRRGISLDNDPNGNFNLYVHSFQGPSAFNFKNGNGGGTLMTIDAVTTNVGIGTTSTTYKLQVHGNISNGGADFILGRNDGLSQGTNPANRALVHDDGDQLVINYGGDFEGGIVMNGSVAIGTNTFPANSTYRLFVVGGVETEKLKVAAQNNWADYVFKEGYKLATLSQVETFIKKNKHLPEVPSEQQVINEGINVAEMDGILLKKIEELTLYVIELNKRIVDLEGSTSHK